MQLTRRAAHRWHVLATVSVAVFMASLDLFIVNIAFPDVARDFDDASVASLSWVLNAYAIVYAALLVPAGRFADRLGRRRVFVAGLLVFLAGSALCGLAPSVQALVAARALQAAGGAALTPTSLALLLPAFAPDQRAKAIGIWAAVGGVAAAAGPPLGGVLVEVSWRLVFLVNLPVGLVAAVLAVRILDESRDAEPGPRPDLAGTALLTAGIGVLALGLVTAPDWGWGSAPTVGCLAAAAALLAGFAVRCTRHPAPVVDPAMLHVRSYAAANAAMLLFSSAFAAMLLGSVLFLTGVWHDSVLRAGLSVSPGPAMAAVFAVTGGMLVGRGVQQRWVGAAGCALFAAGGLWWTLSLDASSDYATELLPGMLVGGRGVGLTLSSLSSAAAAALPPARFATGSAVFTMTRQLGTVLGVAVLVAILGTPDAVDPVGAFRDGFTFMAVAAALAAPVALAIGRIAVPEAARPASLPAERALATAGGG